MRSKVKEQRRRKTMTYAIEANPVFDENGKSVMSGEDVGVVIADELGTPGHHRQRFTAAY